MGVVFRRVMVVDDSDFVDTIHDDEVSEEELLAHADEGSTVSYALRIGWDIDASFLCAAVGLEPGTENEVTDADGAVMSWNPEEVIAARAHLNERLEDLESLAADLIAHAHHELDSDADASTSEVMDVLEKADRGYEPGPLAQPAVGAAALLIRHVLSFRVAARNGESWVISM